MAIYRYSRTTIRSTGETLHHEQLILNAQEHLARGEILTTYREQVLLLINRWNQQAIGYWLRTGQHLFIYTLEL